MSWETVVRLIDELEAIRELSNPGHRDVLGNPDAGGS